MRRLTQTIFVFMTLSATISCVNLFLLSDPPERTGAAAPCPANKICRMIQNPPQPGFFKGVNLSSSINVFLGHDASISNIDAGLNGLNVLNYLTGRIP